ncbi:C39 family peptidase [Polymorphospora rubra]|uniref:Peptidase C39-like domain-containing protein n=1 Tax=Polymorphospora rubra TaxID=338584 RepID=A0A810MT52_9ACTN|nr:C39 family peptidase [Polymorphospora rubra]BCJ64377.1 hypothetical protein Prubr_13980 [Polymorphospora rubra]
MTPIKQWIPTVFQAPVIRKAALGVAGLAMAGGVVAGPATMAHAATPTADKPTTVAAVSQDKSTGAKELDFTYEFQDTYYYCGPAATKMALSADGKHFSQDEVADKLGTTEAGTNSAVDTTRVLKDVTGKDYRTVEIPGAKADDGQTNQLKSDVVKAVDEKRAVVANIAGTMTDVDGDRHSYEGGHYIAVTGYADGGDKVKIGDSWSDKGEYWMSADVLADWIASRGYSA